MKCNGNRLQAKPTPFEKGPSLMLKSRRVNSRRLPYLIRMMLGWEVMSCQS